MHKDIQFIVVRGNKTINYLVGGQWDSLQNLQETNSYGYHYPKELFPFPKTGSHGKLSQSHNHPDAWKIEY